MKEPKSNAYGMTPKYEIGDSVRVWSVLKNPVGTIEYIVDPEASPIKYVVRYQYHDGRNFVEEIAQDDLTLVERRSNFHCNCKTVSDVHAKWCYRYNKPRW